MASTTAKFSTLVSNIFVLNPKWPANTKEVLKSIKSPFKIFKYLIFVISPLILFFLLP